MTRYVLKRLPGAAASVEEVRRLPGLTVLDDIDGEVLLVDAEPVALEALGLVHYGWTTSAEVSFPLPGSGPLRTRGGH